MKTLLVIDDDMTSLDIISYFFEARGYNVERRADGVSAVEAYQDLSPDLVVVDLLMPEVNGVDTVIEMKKIPRVHPPFIAFTAVDDPQMHQAALSAGCDEVLTKPCPTERLLKTIERHLASR